MWLIFGIVTVIAVALIMILWGTSGDNDERTVQDLVRIAQQRDARDQGIFLPIFVQLLRDEFDDDSIREVHVATFYNRIRLSWVHTHQEGLSSDTRQSLAEDEEGGFDSYKQRLVEFGKELPSSIRAELEQDFDAWFGKMDAIIKLSTTKALAQGYGDLRLT